MLVNSSKIASFIHLSEISVYIHWPFCKSKCPYCDFNSHVRGSISTDDFIAAYQQEIAYFADYLKGKTISSIFFGGGTPSLAPVKFFSSVLESLASHASFTKDIEITFEANPTSVESAKFLDIGQTGVNRVSLGIQSFNPQNLKFLGREHSVDEAKHAITIAAQNFKNYSFDLIYAIPNQTIEDLESEINTALTYANGHLSMYQLTIEKGTKFYSQKLNMPKDELSAEMYECVEHNLAANGLLAYEVSNYAKPNYECRHNQGYWNYQDYLGIGAGAHGRITKGNKIATMMIHSPENWLQAVRTKGVGLQTHTELTKKETQEEQLMMGLRLVKGIHKSLVNNPSKLSEFTELGLLEEKENMVRTTLKGRLLLNKIVLELLT